MSDTAITIPAPPAGPAAPAKNWPGVHWWHEKSGFGFHDLLDVINPLQHIPVVSTIYRALTGDEPGAAARIVGDGLFGGLIGFASSVVNVLVQADTGQDIGEHVLSMLDLDGADDKPAPAKAGAMQPATALGATRPAIPLSPSRYIMPTAPAVPAAPASATQKADSGTSDNAASSDRSAPVGSAAGGPSAKADNAAVAAPPAAPPAPLGPSLVQRPVPLRTTGLLLPSGRSRPTPIAAPPAAAAPGTAAAQSSGQPQTAASPAAAASAPASPAGNTQPAAPGGQAVEISQQMSDALDKYARMMQQRQGKGAAGGQLNLVQ